MYLDNYYKYECIHICVLLCYSSINYLVQIHLHIRYLFYTIFENKILYSAVNLCMYVYNIILYNELDCSQVQPLYVNKYC